MAEEVAKQVLDLNYQEIEDGANFNDNLRKIKNLHLIDHNILDLFYLIKKEGNEAAHAINNHFNKDFALKMLFHTYELLVWFVNTYENDAQPLTVDEFKNHKLVCMQLMNGNSFMSKRLIIRIINGHNMKAWKKLVMQPLMI